MIHDVDPFMSSEDIGLGTRWSPEIARQLDATDFGLVVVTRTNLDSRWLNFEAGALGKAVADARVIPVLFDIKKSDVSGPLAQFQMLEWSERSALELLKQINQATERRVPAERLPAHFSLWWPEMAEAVARIRPDIPLEGTVDQSDGNAHRKDRELLEEALDILRGLQRNLNQAEHVPLDKPRRNLKLDEYFDVIAKYQPEYGKTEDFTRFRFDPATLQVLDEDGEPAPPAPKRSSPAEDA